MPTNRAPVTDTIMIAASRLVDDAQTGTREPSHSDIEFLIARVGMSDGDPRKQGQVVGKAKRVRAVLNWGMEYAPTQAELFLAGLVYLVKGNGGFRPESPNYVGAEPIADLRDALRSEGFELSINGDLQPVSLANLSGISMTVALEAYVRRAQRGSEDAALVVGTSKDLLEATAAHIITEIYGSYSHQANFPTLLGQAFTALGLATPHDPVQPGEVPRRRMERALYEAGCAVNALRNKTGTGHGRPFLPALTSADAYNAVQIIGIVAGLLLRELKGNP